jgi:hypothetical protein
MIPRAIAVFTLLGFTCALSDAQQNLAPAPESKIQFGFEQRVRNEDWNNIFDLSSKANDEREQIRYRTMFWANVPLGSNLDFVAGVNQESNQKLGLPSVFDEIIIDRLYLDFKKLFVKGLSLRVGRQNLSEGEGFILFEGTPGDGSRTIYFNAVNLSYTRKKSKLELLGILDPSRDRMLPKINNQNKCLQDWDDQALGAYYTDKNLAKTSFEAYYFYKKEVHDHQAVLGSVVQPDRHISTLGGRVVQQLTPRLSVTGEFAEQWGAQHPDTKIAAWGGYGYVRKKFNGRLKPYVQAGYWAMSGDNPATRNTVENWDPIFSRYPKWSEMYIYSELKEVGIGYTTNVGMWQGEAGFSPMKQLNLRGTYYHMGAFHPYPGSQAVFAAGTLRGDLFETRLDYAINKNWSGHITTEFLHPGDYYRVKSPAYFLQFEIIYRLQFAARMPKL